MVPISAVQTDRAAHEQKAIINNHPILLAMITVVTAFPRLPQKLSFRVWEVKVDTRAGRSTPGKPHFTPKVSRLGRENAFPSLLRYRK